MKFEYDVKECVAFVGDDTEGGQFLCINGDGGKSFCIHNGIVYQGTSTFTDHFNSSMVIKELHPGDKITITF